MTRPLTIGNASGFWGDSIDAPARLVRQVPDLDFLTLDYLAEVSLSVMSIQLSRNPELGYARDFVDAVRSIAPLWREGRATRIVTNAGGLRPMNCARAVAAALAECNITDKKIGVVTGDDVLHILRETTGEEVKSFTNLDTYMPLDTIRERLFTANAYIGARAAADALDAGADIVITGRIADPGMAVAPALHHYGWRDDEYGKIANATVCGPILECGSQACGGIYTHWLEVPDLVHMAFPYCEVEEDGSFVVTIPEGAGGAVTEAIVKEQILYEIGDPGNYRSPDCTLSFLTLKVEQVGTNRVRVSGATGSPPPSSYKVNATYRDGYRASSQITIFGHRAVEKARRAGEVILERLKESGYTYARTNIECLGAGACVPGVTPEPELLETVLRITVHDPDKAKVERFTKELSSLACGGPQGSTGYAGARASVTPVFGFWPCLIEREKVAIKTEVFDIPGILDEVPCNSAELRQ